MQIPRCKRNWWKKSAEGQQYLQNSVDPSAVCRLLLNTMRCIEVHVKPCTPSGLWTTGNLVYLVEPPSTHFNSRSSICMWCRVAGRRRSGWGSSWRSWQRQRRYSYDILTLWLSYQYWSRLMPLVTCCSSSYLNPCLWTSFPIIWNNTGTVTQRCTSLVRPSKTSSKEKAYFSGFFRCPWFRKYALDTCGLTS